MKFRIALASVAGLAALAPAAPAHAIQCTSLTGAVCTTYGTVCRRISTYDQLHQLLCYLN